MGQQFYFQIYFQCEGTIHNSDVTTVLGLQVITVRMNKSCFLPTGPDPESCSSESMRSQVNQVSPTNNQPSNQDAVWEQEEEVTSEESDEPLVQSDEEEVQPDMSLVGLKDVSSVRGSDESDSAGDLPSG